MIKRNKNFTFLGCKNFILPIDTIDFFVKGYIITNFTKKVKNKIDTPKFLKKLLIVFNKI